MANLNAAAANNNVYVVDTFSNRIQKFTSDGTFITEFGSVGSSNGQFDTSHDLALDSCGNVTLLIQEIAIFSCIVKIYFRFL
jgi:DNA-binding beta-propeller fold protein YncE